MTITFKFEMVESSASPLYKTDAIDENGKVVMSWHICANENDDLEEIALAAYASSIAPPVYPQTQP
jgi:hypothetical protein